MAVNMGSAIAYLELDTSKFTNGFQSALSDLNTFADKTQSANTRIQALSGAFNSVGSTLTKNITTPIVGIGAAAVKSSADFESAMSQVAATMGTTSSEITDLKDFAAELGAKTSFSATEAAEGLNILAMSGLNLEEQMATLPNVLNLAAAGSLSLENAASYVTGAIKGFGDSMENSQYYTDLMAKGATLANTDVNMLGAALSGASATAKTYGQNAESTTKSLLRLAEQNVTGSEAATALNRAMQDLYAPTSAAKKALDELGISAYDSTGKSRDFNDIIGELNNALQGMSEEQQIAYKNTIFSTFGMQAYNKMVATTDEKLKQFEDGLRGASAEQDGLGAAAAQAQTQLDNLKGSLILLKSALEGSLIAIGDRLTPYIRQIADTINGLLTRFNELSDEQKDQVVKWGLIAAAIGPVLLVLSKIISSVMGIVNTFKMVGAVLGTSISAPILAIIAAIAALIAAFVHLWENSEEFRDKITNSINSVKDKFDSFQKAFVDKLNQLGFSFEDIGDVIASAWDTICNVIASPILTNAFDYIANVIGDALDIIMDFVDIFVGVFTGDWSAVSDGLENLAKDIVNVFYELPNMILSLIKDLGVSILEAFGLDDAAEVFEEFFNTIQTVFGNVQNFVGNVFSDAISGAFETLVDIVTNVASILGDVWDIFQSLLDGDIASVFEGLVDLFGDVVSLFADNISNILELVGDLGANILEFFGLDGAAEVFNGFFDIIASGFASIADWFSELPANIATFFTETLPNALNAFVEFLTSIGNSIVTFFTETIPNAVVNFVTVTIPEFINSIISWIMQIPEKIAYVIGYCIGLITEIPGKAAELLQNVVATVISWGSEMKTNAENAASEFVTSIVNWITGLPSSISAKLAEIISKVSEWKNNIVSSAKEAISSFVSSIIDAITSLPTKVYNGMMKVVNSILSLKDILKDAGSKIIDGLWDGLMSGINAIKNWIDNVFSFGSSGYEDAKAAARSVDGSHKDGLTYVPYDGYRAELHEGERVLTKQEAEVYNRNRNGSSTDGDTYIFYNTKPEPYEYSRQMKRAKRELATGI